MSTNTNDAVQVYLMMQHAQANFDMKYFMKADDDTYINVPIILHMLQTRTDDHFVYIGKRMTRHEYALLQSLACSQVPRCVWGRTSDGYSVSVSLDYHMLPSRTTEHAWTLWELWVLYCHQFFYWVCGATLAAQMTVSPNAQILCASHHQKLHLSDLPGSDE